MSSKLLNEIRNCKLCQNELPLEPKPILNFLKTTPLILIGQAPGLKTHNIGTPWADKSGVRLREWLGLSESLFYDVKLVAFVPMGFCYPGKGKTGDLPPMVRCAPIWHDKIFNYMNNSKLKVIIGSYAYKYYFPNVDLSLTEKIKNSNLIDYILLPHPSPRNNIWLKKNQWFEKDYIPLVQKKIKTFVNGNG